MSKDEQKFQKAFLVQVKASLRGDNELALRARAKVNFYRKKIDERS
jgi:hypothetical protein